MSLPNEIKPKSVKIAFPNQIPKNGNFKPQGGTKSGVRGVSDQISNFHKKTNHIPKMFAKFEDIMLITLNIIKLLSL